MQMLWQLIAVALVCTYGSALPAPGVGTQYVFLTPQIQRYAVQPTFKFQPELLQTVVPAAAKIDAGVIDKSAVQYVYAYPQYYVLRQDESTGEPWYTQIQNWFGGIGGGEAEGEGQDPAAAAAPAQSAAAAVTPPAQASSATPATRAGLNVVENSDKLFYLTPASTSVLRASDKRFFLLPEQQKVLGSISGPALNPVYTLQPVLSRSAASSIVSAETAPIVVPERQLAPNVLPLPSVLPVADQPSPLARSDLLPLPPVLPVEQPAPLLRNDLVSNVLPVPSPVVPQVNQPVQPLQPLQPLQPSLLKSRIDDALKVTVEPVENRLVPVDDVQTRAGAEVNEEGSVLHSIPVVGENAQVKDLQPEQPLVASNANPTENEAAIPQLTNPSQPTQFVAEATAEPAQIARVSNEVVSNANVVVVNDVVPAPVVVADESKVKRETIPLAIDAKSPQTSASDVSEVVVPATNSFASESVSVIQSAPVPAPVLPYIL